VFDRFYVCILKKTQEKVVESIWFSLLWSLDWSVYVLLNVLMHCFVVRSLKTPGSNDKKMYTLIHIDKKQMICCEIWLRSYQLDIKVVDVFINNFSPIILRKKTVWFELQMFCFPDECLTQLETLALLDIIWQIIVCFQYCFCQVLI